MTEEEYGKAYQAQIRKWRDTHKVEDIKEFISECQLSLYHLKLKEETLPIPGMNSMDRFRDWAAIIATYYFDELLKLVEKHGLGNPSA